MRQSFALFTFMVLSLSAWAQDPNESIYRKALADAAYVQASEISKTLKPIARSGGDRVWKTIAGEEFVLVATWQNDTVFYKNSPETGFYNTGKYEVWVTAAPDLQNWAKTAQFKNGIDLRIKQLLGLPPNAKKRFFVEFWVRPQDLFRPCPDAEITDSECNTCFPESSSPEHKEWINNMRANSYSNCTLYYQYPWTQLGYTYDWNPKNKTHIGLSEYVIRKNANVVVHKFYTTEAYIEKK
jgi:hypothetical protein